MGIMSKIGKGLAIGGAGLATLGSFGAATPLLGGAIGSAMGMGGGILGKIGKGASALAPVLGKASGAQAQSRQQDVLNNEVRDRTALDRFKVAESLPGERQKTGVKASMVANASPVSINRAPGRGGHTTVTGGYANPDLINGDTRAMSNDITHQMMLKQLQHGSDVPQATPIPGENFGEKMMGGGAFGTSILAALNAFKKKPVTGAQNSMSDNSNDTPMAGGAYGTA